MLPITENTSFELCLRHAGNPDALSTGAEHLPSLIPAFDFKNRDVANGCKTYEENFHYF